MGTNIIEVNISDMMQFFEFSHLSERLKKVSAPFYQLAWEIFENLPLCQEKYEALHKLLEAKDCAVRAQLTGGV